MEPKYFDSLYPASSHEREIKQIIGFVQGGNSMQLLGLPGVGRANALSLLAHNHKVRAEHLGSYQKWVHFVLINFSEIKERSTLELTKFIFLSLMESLKERGLREEYEKVAEEFRQSLSFQDELVLFQGLKSALSFLCLEKKLTLVLLCDRFSEYIPTLNKVFFANMRILRNLAKYRFSLVLSLERPLEETVEAETLSDFYEFIAGHYVYMRLTDPVSQEFRLRYLEKITGKKIDEKCLQETLDLTGGHWRLVKLCSESLLGESKHEGSLAEFFLTKETIKEALRKIWDSFIPDEQQALLTSSSGGIETDTKMKEYLEHIGILKEGSIQIPLLSMVMPKASQTDEHIYYDAEQNALYKGKTEITDRFTASEYRLLLSLLARSEQVLTRDEIISSVWKESMSTAGVTDQALDQLIFRLRKKIESDPNNPTHLQTIKGRGFKFTP